MEEFIWNDSTTWSSRQHFLQLLHLLKDYGIFSLTLYKLYTRLNFQNKI
jgi:hypothetical protein